MNMTRLAARVDIPPNSGVLRDQLNLSLAQTMGRVDSISDSDCILFGQPCRVHKKRVSMNKRRDCRFQRISPRTYASSKYEVFEEICV